MGRWYASLAAAVVVLAGGDRASAQVAGAGPGPDLRAIYNPGPTYNPSVGRFSALGVPAGPYTGQSAGGGTTTTYYAPTAAAPYSRNSNPFGGGGYNPFAGGTAPGGVSPYPSPFGSGGAGFSPWTGGAGFNVYPGFGR